MSFVITSNEPPQIKKLFGEDAIETPMDFDMMLYTQRGQICIERKAVPGDLIASVRDGRLGREIRAMRHVSRFYIVLLHGQFIFRRDDTLSIPGARGAGSEWTRKGIKNLLRTMQYVEGAFLEYAENDEELVELISQLQDYFDKTHHLSMRMRPPMESNWLIPTRDEKIQYFYQGLPRISALRARMLSKRFPSPVDIFGASIEDIMAISGFGKTLATGIYNFLRGES